jgi:hypothetical protein
MGATLDSIFLRRGVLTVPPLADTGSAYVMLIKLGTQAAQVWDFYQNPTPDKGRCLARLVRRSTAHIRVI